MCSVECRECVVWECREGREDVVWECREGGV